MRKKDTDQIKVSIVCLTYNHGELLEKALQSFIAQETEFAFEIIVHDDASTDGTSKLLERYAALYPDIIKPIFQIENQYWKCPIFLTYVLPRVRGEYIAICDGDDYWIDDKKLSKQVTFMDDNPECTLFIHNGYREYMENGKRESLNTFPSSGFYSHRENVMHGLGTDFPVSSSMLLRTSILEDAPTFFLKTKALDYPLRQYCACKGSVFYSDEIMSVYRVNTPTSFMRKTRVDEVFYRKYTLEMIQFFEKYNVYTDGKFYPILKTKIASDYYGFCASYSKDDSAYFYDDIRESGIDADRAIEYYKKISVEYIDYRIKELKENTDQLFIYGTSRLANICARQMKLNNVDFDGFAVSEGQIKVDTFEEKRVFYLGEIENIEKCGFVIAVQPTNVHFLVDNLKAYKCNNYCIPYNE